MSRMPERSPTTPGRVGSRFGPYEIVSPLGSGGMGEVFRARDTRLDRNVAIKFLHAPKGRSDAAALRLRFQREAKAISSLAHPHICALYDVGEDADFLVMELVDGESLAEKLQRGPLPLAQVIRYGAEIADALEHAHRAGIVHRDLKPANIMITNSGAKLLDFGLAKLSETPVVSGPSDVTTPVAVTAEGAIVGTLHYMSPEQIEGKALDHRSDIFSLGVVLYEMATGRRPFAAASQASLMAAILSSDPPTIRSLHPGLPAALESIIRGALEKNPNERWQSAHDVARLIRGIDESAISDVARAAAQPSKWRSWSLVAGLAAGLLVGLVPWMLRSRAAGTEQPSPGEIRLDVALPPGVDIRTGFDTNNFAISPDGRRLVFAAFASGKRALYERDLASDSVRAIASTEDAVAPFWSPDGQWLGYSAAGKLWKLRVNGAEPPVAICDVAAGGAVAAWNGEVILFSDAIGGGQPEIMMVPDAGGKPVAATTLDVAANEYRHLGPRFLPDRKRFVYQAMTKESVERRLMLQSIGKRDARPIISNVSSVAFAGDRMIYVRDGVLLSQRFDSNAGNLVGEPVTLARDVSYFYATAGADFDASMNGVVVFRSDTSQGELVEVNRTGAVVKKLDEGENFYTVAIDRAGRRAAVTIMNHGTGLGDIWTYDLARGVRDRFTSDPGMEVYPVWSPDGKWVVYSRTGGGNFPHLVRRRVNGSDDEPLIQAGFFDVASSFSPDGSELYITRRDQKKNVQIFRYSMATKQLDRPLDTTFPANSPQLSPDGRWLAFALRATGSPEVYLQDMSPGEHERIRISTDGGNAPRWSVSGDELFFASGKRQLISARPGAAKQWSEPVLTPLFSTEEIQDYAPTNDGGFLVCRSRPGAADSLLHVLLTH